MCLLLQITRLPSGLAIASVETYAPISRVAFVANAGTRFETGDNLGITHCLRLASGLVRFLFTVSIVYSHSGGVGVKLFTLLFSFTTVSRVLVGHCLGNSG